MYFGGVKLCNGLGLDILGTAKDDYTSFALPQGVVCVYETDGMENEAVLRGTDDARLTARDTYLSGQGCVCDAYKETAFCNT